MSQENDRFQQYKYLVKLEMNKLNLPVDWLQDYYQEGCIGLLQAIRKKKANQNEYRFKAFARKYIRGAMLKINLSLIRVPRNVANAAMERTRSITEIAADKRNDYTETSLLAAKQTIESNFVPYDSDLHDAIHSLEQNRLELAEQLEQLLDTLKTAQQWRALECHLNNDSFIALDRLHGKCLGSHDTSFRKLKKRIQRNLQ